MNFYYIYICVNKIKNKNTNKIGKTVYSPTNIKGIIRDEIRLKAPNFWLYNGNLYTF